MATSSETKRLKALARKEEALRQRGYVHVAGVDEAGRGPLAGPVVSAACILPPGLLIEGIDDSKKISAEKRSALYEKLTNNPDIFYGIGVVEAILIDHLNILRATFEAMVAAVVKLNIKPDYILVDGPKSPFTDIVSEAVIDGDALCLSIAAASIIAKEYRDRLMHDYDDAFPLYGFAKHKGYGTEEHLIALKKHGPCPIHRMSFAPVRMASDPKRFSQEEFQF